MALQVFTARISYGGPDRLDITRKGHSVFGPSAGLLSCVLALRAAKALDESVWNGYSLLYLAEMRLSYRIHRAAWRELLARKVATLCCYCTDAELCHRRLLAQVLVKLGAQDMGER